MVEHLLTGLEQVFLPAHLLLTFAGVAGGVMIGALPGLTGTMAIALLVPFTYGMAPAAALVMLGGVYVGSMFGGSISATLVNTPGTPAAIATTFDGNPLARKGMAEHALTGAAISSFVGGMSGTLVLLFFSPLLATIALQFGPPEYFWLGIFGLTIIGTLASESVLKGLAGGAFGVLISTIGFSPFAGVARFTFDQPALLGGVELIVALIGLFAIPEVLSMAEAWRSPHAMATYQRRPGVAGKVIRQVLGKPYALARASVIGIVVGIIPGAGGNVAGLVSYNEAVRASREPKRFGTGVMDGVVASETANNAEVEGSLVPLLTLGIPGAPQAAVLLGALLLQGLRPGPQLYTGDGATITYTFILSLFVANIMMFVVGLYGSRLYAHLLNLSVRYLVPTIVVLSTVGAYAIRNNPTDVIVMMVIGLVAYIGKKLGFHPGPIALGIILGPMVETGLLQTLQLSQATGSVWLLLLTRPISIVLIVLSLLSAGWPLIAKRFFTTDTSRGEGAHHNV